MKKCPECGHIYHDETLNFCLKDGERLFVPQSSQATVVLPPDKNTKFSSATTQKVSPIFAYLSFGLIALLTGGGIVAFVFFNYFSEKKEIAQVHQSNSPQSIANSTSSPPPPVIYVPEESPSVVKIPVPPSASKTTGLKYYNGTVGGSSAAFNLVWNKNKTISGNYYFSSSPNNIYSISGTNYVEGTSELRVFQGNTYVGQMTLEKSLEGSNLCWQGNFSSQNQHVRFCRRR